MTNMTLKKCFENMLFSFKNLLKESQISKGQEYYEYNNLKKSLQNNFKNLKYNKIYEINFNNYSKDEKIEYNPFLDNEFIEKSQIFLKEFNIFLEKIVKVERKLINNILFKNTWDVLKELLDWIQFKIEFKKELKFVNILFLQNTYSLIDKIFNEFSVEIFKINNPIINEYKKIKNDSVLNCWFNDASKFYPNKSKIIYWKEYDKNKNSIKWEIKKNNIFDEFKNTYFWDIIKNIRNDLEHIYTIRYFYEYNNSSEFLELFLKFLIALNFYCIYECDKNMENIKK